MCLEICGLISNKRIYSAVRFVKSIAGKFRHKVKYLFSLLLVNFILFGAINEFFPLNNHLLRKLLAHSLSQHISISRAKICKDFCNLHNLFLINDNAVCICQYVLKLRKFIFYRRLALFSLYKILNHAALQRPRSVKSNNRHDIFKGLRLEFSEQFFCTGFFQLEYSVCISRTQKPVCVSIIEV